MAFLVDTSTYLNDISEKESFMKNLSISLLISIMMACLSIQTNALPKEGLVLHYSFNASGVNGDKIKDLSGNGNEGVINGGGKLAGDGLGFDGKAVYVVTPALDVRTGAKSFTAICRFKTDNPKNGPLWMWGDKNVPSTSSGAEGPVGWKEANGNFAAGFYTNAHQYAEAKENYADNKWHIVAQVGDEDTGYLYVDGSQISSANAGYVYAAKPYFIIGARTKNSGNDIDNIEYFVGTIGMVIIYKKALKEADIKSITSEVLTVSSLDNLASKWGQIRQ